MVCNLSGVQWPLRSKGQTIRRYIIYHLLVFVNQITPRYEQIPMNFKENADNGPGSSCSNVDDVLVLERI